MMKFFRRIVRRMQQTTPASESDRADQDNVTVLFERARQFYHSGRYDDALEILDRVSVLTEKVRDPSAGFMAELSRASVYAKQLTPDRAGEILERLQKQAETLDRSDLMALVQIGSGILAQEEGDLERADSCYEQALRLAREAASERLEGRAQGHLADVALKQNNASFAIYLLKEALPKLNTSSDMEMQSYFIGLLGQALIAGGELREGEQFLSRALRIADHMGYREYERMWRKSLAARAVERGNYGEARRHYEALMVNSVKDTSKHISLLCRLSKVSLRAGDYSAALDYARQALDMLDENTSNPGLRLVVEVALGVALRARGQNEEALEYLVSARDAYKKEVAVSPEYSYVEFLRNLAAVQSVVGEVDAALETYAEALAQASASDGELDMAGIYRDRGILYMHANRLQEAIHDWTQALQIYERNGQTARVARLYCDMANLRRQIGQFQRALEDYGQSLMLLSSVNDDETRGIILANAAAAYIDQGDIETAESFFIDAIKIAQKLNDRQAEATRRGNYGWFLLSTGRADRAIASLSYALRQSENLDMKLQMAVQLDNMGLALLELGKVHEALKHHRRALEIIEELDDPYWKGMIEANLAHTLIQHSELDEARVHLNNGLDVARAEQKNDLLVRALSGLIRIDLQTDQLDEVEPHIAEAVAAAELIQSRRLVGDVLSLRSEFMARTDRIEMAERDWQRARQLYELLQLPVKSRTPGWVIDSMERNSDS